MFATFHTSFAVPSLPSELRRDKDQSCEQFLTSLPLLEVPKDVLYCIGFVFEHTDWRSHNSTFHLDYTFMNRPWNSPTPIPSSPLTF